MTTETNSSADERAEYIAGLRMLADLLEQNPHLKLPFYGDISPMRVLVCNDEPQEQREQLAMWARVLPGQKDKQAGGTTDQFLMLGANLRGIRIEVQADRDDVCERIVLGKKTVVETVPDPAYMAAAPMVERETVEEIVEWRCGAILSAVSA